MSVRSILVLGALIGAAVAQNVQPKPVEPAKLPADWDQRDLEGKWVAFRSATGDVGGDARRKEAWAKALAAKDEIELLEWIAVYEGWRQAGPQLARLDSPQLLRAAAWNLGALDSHNLENAEAALRKRGSIAVGWFEEHPVAKRGKAAAIYEELRGQFDAGDASHYLPPHDAMQVLVPWLDAPAEVEDFGDRLTAAPRARYIHQVLRALDGVAVFGSADPIVVAKVLALCRHAHPVVHRAAFNALSKLPSDLVPHRGLIDLSRDGERPAGLRHLAATALSYSSHPDAFFELHAIADQPDHPGRLAAIKRLGEVGDQATLIALGRFAVEKELDVMAAIQGAVKRIGERKRKFDFLKVGTMRTLLRRIAWLRATGDPRADAHVDAGKRLLTHQNSKGGLQSVVDAVLDMPKSAAPFTEGEAERVDRELRKFVDELSGK